MLASYVNGLTALNQSIKIYKPRSVVVMLSEHSTVEQQWLRVAEVLYLLAYMYNYGRSEWSPIGYYQVLHVLPQQYVNQAIGIRVQQRTAPPGLSEHPTSDYLTHQYTH